MKLAESCFFNTAGLPETVAAESFRTAADLGLAGSPVTSRGACL